ncbi:MAG: nuclear transport factor 2 family protein [Xanthobacteraceae bacterium]|jgi:ketosteroid isomerase-like protein|nr:nuclear transport factor 2 family protein [Xanthobacteraceae bacterium]
MNAAARNREILETAFAEAARGNGAAFRDAMADDIRWTVPGTMRCSKTYEGKENVLVGLFRPVMAQLDANFSYRATRFVAEDDIVVVQLEGRNTTTSGKPYNNSYCYVCRMEDGKLKDVVEYLDTKLFSELIEPGAFPAK